MENKTKLDLIDLYNKQAYSKFPVIKAIRNGQNIDINEGNRKDYVDKKLKEFETSNLEDLSQTELNIKINLLYNEISECQHLIKKKKLGDIDLNFKDKFLKIIETDCPIYIKCTNCTVCKNSVNNIDSIFIQGIGFSSNFGPYSDSNYVDFETDKVHYMSLASFLTHEGIRKSGKSSPDKFDYNHYSIVIITEEDYLKAFNDLHDKFKKTILEWINK